MGMKIEKVKEAQAILEKKKEVPHEVHIIPDAKHGFAVRAFPTDEKQMECARLAEEQTLAWFAKWIG